MQLGNWGASGKDFKFSAAPRDQTLIIKLQAHTSTGNFKTGGSLIIPDDQVHRPERDGIEGASYSHSEFAETKRSAIVDCCLEAGRVKVYGIYFMKSLW